MEIEICSYSREGRTIRWADRRAWKLEDKLPEVLREIEIRAAEDEHRRVAAERAAAERRCQWEVAVEHAEVALVESSRADHLVEQTRH